ncbi:MAG: response regulator transcription factor [Ruminococcaceae bacterium]|nr:response regulator transcription factor [Oscillospiraceae bacterium]
MKKILIVEDEANIREFVVINLQRAGYEVLEAGSAEEALEIYAAQKGSIDIALLDIMLPGMDGVTLCRTIRKEDSDIGIILLTARTQEIDKVGGLMMGADDYVTKPFSPSELVARVDALYRRVVRSGGNSGFSEELRSGSFVLNLRSRTLHHNEKQIDLTQVEFQLLEYLMSNPDTALSRTGILSRVWGEDYYGEEKIVDVNIRRLRMKIEEDPSNPRHIGTVWGFGYKWNG